MTWPDDPNEAEKIIGPIYDDFAAKAAEDPFFQPFADKLKEELDNAPADPVPEPPPGSGDLFKLVSANKTYDGSVAKLSGTYPFGQLLALTGTLSPTTGEINGSGVPTQSYPAPAPLTVSQLPAMVMALNPADPEDPSQGTLVLKYGIVRYDSWIFPEDGSKRTLFAGNNGQVVTGIPFPTPGNTNIIQPVGSIVANHVMWFYPSSTMFTYASDGEGGWNTVPMLL